VETLEQADLLADIGCDQLQGFYFFKPAPDDLVTPKLLKEMGLKV
jgi:EAL domain-containing protein (putative c-di-GMP-specific phosphodiesterase class I)